MANDDYTKAIKAGQANLERARTSYKQSRAFEDKCRREKSGSSFVPPFPKELPEPKTEQQEQAPKQMRPGVPEGLIKIQPMVGIAAGRKHKGGAWRLWTFARALDTDGLGRVVDDELRAFVSSAGASDRQYRRWRKRALDLGVLRSLEKRDGRIWLAYVNLARAAVLFGCERVERSALIPLRRLAATGWQAFIFASFLKVHERESAELGNVGYMVSRRKLEAITGVPERTQYQYEQVAGVQRDKNFAISNVPGAQLNPEHKQSFVIKPTKKSGFVIASRLPDARFVPLSSARKHTKGRMRKANKLLKYGLSSTGQASSERVAIRQFHDTHKSRRNTERKLRRLGYEDKPHEPIDELYQRWPGTRSRRGQFWSIYDV